MKYARMLAKRNAGWLQEIKNRNVCETDYWEEYLIELAFIASLCR